MVSVLFYKNSTKVYKNNSTCINNCHYNEIYNFSLHYLIKFIKSILYI
jgi:isocitrate dehydrogenase